MRAIRLKTEYLFDPLGIDVRHPRLMWNCEGGVKQTAYALQAYVNGALVAELTSADSSFSWEGAAGTDEIRLVFSGEGYAELGTPVNASGMILLIM